MATQTRTLIVELEDAFRRFAPIGAALLGMLLVAWLVYFVDEQWDPARASPLVGYGIIGGGAGAALLAYGFVVGLFSMINPKRRRTKGETICVALAAALTFGAAWMCFAGPAILIQHQEARIVELKEPRIVEEITDRRKLEDDAQFMRNQGVSWHPVPTKIITYAAVDSESIRKSTDKIRRLERVKSPIQALGIALSVLGITMLAILGVRLSISK